MAFSRLAVKPALVALACLLGSCSTAPKLDSFGAVVPFTLTDQNGSSFNSADKLKGQVWIADFMFTTCPGPCPRMSSQMHQMQMKLEGQGIKLVSFTVDPVHDTPEVLTAYGKMFKASPGVWYFLTGAPADIQHLSNDVFKLPVSVVNGNPEHSTRFALVDDRGQIRGYYLSSEPEALQKLMEDATSLLRSKG